MRKRIFEIIEIAEENDKASRVYDVLMIVVIMASLIPLMIYEQTKALTVIDQVTVAVFILDYILRFMTADYKLGKGALSFLVYPLTPMAIIDLLAILPSFAVIAPGFKVLKIFRMLRSFRVFRAFKAVRYSKSIAVILAVIRNMRKPLLTVFALAVGYVFLVALLMFNVEPETFDYNFFTAMYWATISLTTMGYGDISPISELGRFLTMVSSLVGIAVVALPSGIVTAGYMTELQAQRDREAAEGSGPEES